MQSGKIYYADEAQACVLKLVGDIRYTMGCSLDGLVDQQLAREDLEVVFIDLSEATGIDSTSLGLLAKIANIMRSRGKDEVIIISPNPDINEILNSMGFDEIFTICEGNDACPCASTPVPVTNPNKDKMAQTVLDAHRRLCDLNEKNRAAFAGVIGALENKLASI